METAKSYLQLLDLLRTKFSDNPKHTVRLLGLVFCRPDNILAKEEILPSLGWYHRRSGNYQIRSGKNIDFYFAGFDRNATPKNTDVVVSSGIPAKPNWIFDDNLFDEFRLEIQRYTSWQYSGLSDFMLVNCHYDKNGEPRLDFDGSVILNLETLRNQERLPGVGMFFESIFNHCEAINEDDEAWGCGLDDEPGSALVELCRSYLKNPAGSARPSAAEPNPKTEKEVKAKESLQETPALIKGMFRYDLGKKSLSIMPSGRRLLVPTRYAEVLGQIFKREEGLYAIRASHIDYEQTAIFWEMGKWKENDVSLNEIELRKKLRRNLAGIQLNAKKTAHEFRRQFSRWLRENGIEADAVLTAERKNHGYKLGTGWHQERMVINDSEAGVFYAGNYIEKYSPDSDSGKKTPTYMGGADDMG